MIQDARILSERKDINEEVDPIIDSDNLTLRLSKERNGRSEENNCLDRNNLVQALLDRADDLSPDAINATHVLENSFLEFLSSSKGREFRESLRLETYNCYYAARIHSQRLQQEVERAEEQVRITASTFAFVEALATRLRHEERN